ncbi:helix-turn-helix transcriptional regulator [Polaromonas sp.]|uniref:helix-turn-helix transcriptional regulator n=1 Tax=Polaromonas sp. TaxID=1869339 RepID=UPI0017AE85D5|nr:helix-turn-helix transcriptional regulator [Polaromonas sp.]NML85142.1 helix-turn-helix transcriptional regulator [Polaromonas sp.]
MQLPANFDSVSLDGIMSDWLLALREFSVEAIAVLGPDPFAGLQHRLVVALHPPRLLEAARALAEGQDSGVPQADAAAPLVSWQLIVESAFGHHSRWRRLWLGYGYQSVVRIEFPLVSARAFEVYLFSPRQWHDRNEAAALVWSALNIWPLLSRAIAEVRNPLSPRELECLKLAFQGLTARASGEVLLCSERTINFHLANAMSKLKVDSKLAAVQRACWLGLI